MYQHQPATPPFFKFIPGIFWFALVLVLVCIPGDELPKDNFFDFVSFDKIVHAGLFGGIVFWFAFAYYKWPMAETDKKQLFFKLMLASIVWGITTELIQKYFVVNRQFDWMDWLADSAGAVAAYFLAVKWFATPKPPIAAV
jgi:hypothetical protein